MTTDPTTTNILFQSTPPARGATITSLVNCLVSSLFQSTPPARGATGFIQRKTEAEIVISIHAPREGGDDTLTTVSLSGYISIHAPREGGDIASFGRTRTGTISIHAPREGGDPNNAGG